MASAAIKSATTTDLIKEKSLRDLLDGIVLSQRNDIMAFSKGHLNESKLPKPPGMSKHKSWRSAHKPRVSLCPPSKLPPSKRDTANQDQMQTTMLEFSVGTAGSLPVRSKKAKSKMTSRSASGQSVSADARRAGDVLVEELTIPEAMLVRTEYTQMGRLSSRYYPKESDNQVPASRGTTKGQGMPGTPTTLMSQSHGEIMPLTKHEFMPAHFEAVTKRDQFLKFKEFENVVLRKGDASEQNVMSGVKAVSHLEEKLQMELSRLSYQGYGPNFHQLQIYSNTFEDLIQESTLFGPILETIKREYDEYIASLLDGQPAKHRVLHNQVQQLNDRRSSTAGLLQEEMHQVQLMESEAKKLLETNERLRAELAEEIDLANPPPQTEVITQSYKSQRREENTGMDLSDRIEELKATILEKLDQMNDLKTKLRTECVPSTVCSHLEQCIKETEVEIQKLTSQKEFFDRSTTDMEKELQVAIDTADTTKKDARHIWKKITAVKSLDINQIHKSPGGGITTTGPGGNASDSFHNSDDEQDDERKWNWYIS